MCSVLGVPISEIDDGLPMITYFYVFLRTLAPFVNLVTRFDIMDTIQRYDNTSVFIQAWFLGLHRHLSFMIFVVPVLAYNYNQLHFSISGCSTSNVCLIGFQDLRYALCWYLRHNLCRGLLARGAAVRDRRSPVFLGSAGANKTLSNVTMNEALFFVLHSCSIAGIRLSIHTFVDLASCYYT